MKNSKQILKFIELFKNCKYGTRHGLEKRDVNSFYAGGTRFYRKKN